jgi:predicted metal-dependent peptidase
MFNLVTEETVRKDIARLFKSKHSCFYGMILLKCKIKVEKCGTAYVDGTHLGIDPEWWGKLNKKQRTTVLEHEAMHLTNLHNYRQGNRVDPQFNIACDFGINGYLQEPRHEFPEKGCIERDKLLKYKGKAVEAIYQDIIKEEEDKPKPEPEKGEEEGEESEEENPNPVNPPPSDPESGEPEASDETEEESNESSSNGANEGQESEGESESIKQTETWGEVRQAPDQSEEAQRKAEREIQKAISIAKGQGTLPAGIEETFSDLLKPEVNWTDILGRWMEGITQSDYSWRVPNPVFMPQGFIIPTSVADAFAQFAVAVDTSGSVSDEELKQAIADILQASATCIENGQDMEIPVIWCDSEVGGVQMVSDPSDILKPVGRGGTYFTPAIEEARKLEETPLGLIYITDGYGDDFPKNPPCDMLWIITKDGDYDFKPPYGDVIQMRDYK